MHRRMWNKALMSVKYCGKSRQLGVTCSKEPLAQTSTSKNYASIKEKRNDKSNVEIILM